MAIDEYKPIKFDIDELAQLNRDIEISRRSVKHAENELKSSRFMLERCIERRDKMIFLKEK